MVSVDVKHHVYLRTLALPRTDEMVSCVWTDSRSEIEDKLFSPYCCRNEFGIFGTKSNERTRLIRIEESAILFDHLSVDLFTSLR